MAIPFFNPVLGENELTALCLKGFGVDLCRFGEAASTCDGGGRFEFCLIKDVLLLFGHLLGDLFLLDGAVELL